MTSVAINYPNTVYSRYIAVVYIAESDISRSHVGSHFLATRPRPRSWETVFREICSPRFAFDPARRRQFSAESALGLPVKLILPLYHRVGSY